MGRHVREEIMRADIELRRFFAYQRHEIQKIGYPRMSAFARNIAKGTLAPAPVEDDPIMDAVGAFYATLKEIEKRTLAEHYEGAGTRGERARSLGISVNAFKRKLDRLQERCMGWIRARGF